MNGIKKKLLWIGALVALNSLLFGLNTQPASAFTWDGMCVVSGYPGECICSSHTMILDCDQGEDSDCYHYGWCNPE